jgi:hypothetical protein
MRRSGEGQRRPLRSPLRPASVPYESSQQVRFGFFDSQFRKDVMQVNFHCSFFEIEMLRDLFVAQAFSHESGHVPFS